MTRRGAGSADDRVKAYINQQVEALRVKLLDLSRRNPLVSTPLGGRSTAFLRIVDELPDQLFEKIISGSMEFIPLPPLDDDPRDEQAQSFKDALAAARLTDEQFLTGLDHVDSNDRTSADKIAALERALKDRVRERVGLPRRQSRDDLSIVTHAKNNKIIPDYDLPDPRSASDDDNEKYTDNYIQTLLFKEDLERRLNAIIAKNRSWEDETGVSVLRIAIGFVEWVEPVGKTRNFAPLVCIPVKIVKERSRSGYRYSVSADSDQAETNAVIAKKLEDEFGIILPKFAADSSLETLFAKVSKSVSSQAGWKIRRQVVVGVFPSQQLAMYEDLNTTTADFSSFPIVDELLGGADGDRGDTPYAEEYDVDAIDIAPEAPILIADADASQYSAVYDAIAGARNLAIEGPPGTGKSQTIVNIIASAMGQGQKVLFVAAKTAALDVVRSRLEAWGLGDFVLPLIASRESRKDIVGGLKKRIGATKRNPSLDYERVKKRLVKNREQLRKYVDLLEMGFRDSGRTVYDALGYATRARQSPRYESMQYDTLATVFNEVSVELRDEVIDQARRFYPIQEAFVQESGTWSDVSVPIEDQFEAEDILMRAKEAAVLAHDLAASAQALRSLGALVDDRPSELAALEELIVPIAAGCERIDLAALKSLCLVENQERLGAFLDKCKAFDRTRAEIAKQIDGPQDATGAECLRKLADYIEQFESEAVDTEDLANLDTILAKEERGLSNWVEFIKSAFEITGAMPSVSAASVHFVAELLSVVPGSALELRHRILEQSSTRIALREAMDEGERLAAVERVVARTIPDPCQFRADQVESLLEALGRGRAGRVLRPSSWAARRKIKRMFRSPPTEGPATARVLSDLHGFLHAKTAFEQSDRLATILADRYRGHNSAFADLRALVDFYDRVYTELVRKAEEPLLEFVRHASPSQLVALNKPRPVLGDRIPGACTLSELEEHHARICRLKEQAADSMEAIRYALGVIKPREKMKKIEIVRLAGKLEMQIAHEVDLDSSEEVRAILFGLFAGSATNSEMIAATRRAADVAVNVPGPSRDAIIDAIIANGISEVQQHVCAVRDMLERTNQAIGEVERRSGVTIERPETYKEYGRLEKELLNRAADRTGLLIAGRLAAARKRLAYFPYHSTIESLAEGCDSGDDIAEAVSQVLDIALARAIHREYGGVLGRCDGKTLDEMRSQVRRLDKALIECAREDLRNRLLGMARPPAGNGRGAKRDYTEMALIRHETQKEKRHISPRELTQRAAEALVELKPCWMMSPLAVAQYLKRGQIEFDLIIIDEASQMTPEQAIGPLSRGKRAVVVGDTNQLPPSNFFRKMLSDDDEEDYEAVTEESILELANAAFYPKRRLRWHYRSRHSSLIAFSNRHVYDDELVVFSGPSERKRNMGVGFVKVTGEYLSGANVPEAKAIADYVKKIMIECPDRSLGVVVMNQKQQALLQEDIESRLASSTAMRRYKENWESRKDGLEPFFVKNLENVQGDERDVIIIGTVYGPGPGTGAVMQRFGPINGIAGKRRLNVLFTRAREQILTFSSMTASDIRFDGEHNAGKVMLRHWLEYCATGKLPAPVVVGKEPESPFEQHVIEQIRAMGFTAVPQVGVAKFRIDIGVEYPEWPHGFVLGVECDGATYHSTKCARDRDRLRQEVLEGLGWQLHRIWSTDWFKDAVGQTKKLREVLEARVEHLLRDRSAIRDAAEAVPLQFFRQPEITAGGSGTVAGERSDDVAEQSAISFMPEDQEEHPPEEHEEAHPAAHLTLRPPYSVVLVTKVRPETWRDVSAKMNEVGLLNPNELSFMATVAKTRALELPLSPRQALRAFQILETAAEHQLYEFE